MKVMETRLLGVKLIDVAVFGDRRGYFMESYSARTFANGGINITFVQENSSFSAEAGVVRGLHYQLNPVAQTKLIRVISGAIFDVVLDIRRGSPTFGQWQSFILSSANKRQLLVPKGMAHGYCTLVAKTEMVYKVDEFYSPVHDRGIAWDDPVLAIDWPVVEPILSDKDAKHPRLADAEMNFAYDQEGTHGPGAKGE